MLVKVCRRRSTAAHDLVHPLSSLFQDLSPPNLSPLLCQALCSFLHCDLDFDLECSLVPNLGLCFWGFPRSAETSAALPLHLREVDKKEEEIERKR